MNGATAVPFVSTINPPNTAIITKIGSSQNFLRTRKNAQNSRRNDIAASELVLHGVRCRPRWFPRNPVTRHLSVNLEPQNIFFENAKQQTDGCDHDEEHQPHHDGADDPEQNKAKFGPDPVERGQPFVAKERNSQRDRCGPEPPWPQWIAHPDLDGSDQREEGREYEAEAAIRGALDLLFAGKVLVETLAAGHLSMSD